MPLDVHALCSRYDMDRSPETIDRFDLIIFERSTSATYLDACKTALYPLPEHFI